MATTTLASPASDTCLAEALPLDPHRSLRVRFGMLLGEDDFVTLAANPRGKMWLHSAWLHRHGVVWGLGVELAPDEREVRVRPGLAVDPLGRELSLDALSCLDVGAWFDAHRDDPDFDIEDLGGGRFRFTTHVTIRFRSCLDRPVPAMAEPCAGDARTTSYSRVVETVHLELVPNAAPPREPPPAPYPRLRQWYGVVDPAAPVDPEVEAERTRVAGLLPGEVALGTLEAVRRLAALDVVDLAPAPTADGEGVTRFPGKEPGELVLAQVDEIVLAGSTGSWTLESGTVDNRVRSALVATSTIQELLAAITLP